MPLTFRFDGFELRQAERQLLRDGAIVPLRPKAFDLLLALVESSGQLVTKQALLEGVWPGRVVEENNIAAQIASLRKTLGGELIATVPGHGYRFTGSVTPSPGNQGPGNPAPIDHAPYGGPPLFGREQVLARARDALRHPGCVTLVGPAGVGKTSLARAVFAAAAKPAYWVDLTSLTAGEQIFPALCRSLGLSRSESDAVAAAAAVLADSSLLVLDNAEHLLDAVAANISLLARQVPGLHLLVTSQASIGVEGERSERLDPLEIPDAAATEPEAMAAGAVAMFIDRVRAADSRFQLPLHAFALVRRVCQELDGLPLAIEMAAARVPLLGLEKVQEALAERFVALRHHKRDTPTRHRTLETAFAWSYDLLSHAEQDLFRALGVCAGGFTSELAVELVDADRWDTLDCLSSLIDRSLVVSNHEDPPRYRLLETVRAYSLARLREAAREAPVRARHAQALTQLFQIIHDAKLGPETEPVRHAALLEMENAREAIAWAMENQPELAVRLSAYVARRASATVWRSEAYRWLSACEALARGPLVQARWRALWFRHFAAQSLFFDDPRALERAREAVAICRAAGESLHLAYSLIYMARAFDAPGTELDAVVQDAGELLAENPDWDVDLQVLWLNCEGHAHELGGHVDKAIASWRRGIDVARSANLRRGETFTSFTLARALLHMGQPAEALAVLAAMVPRGDQDDLTMLRCELLKARVMLEQGRWHEVAAGCAVLLQTAHRMASGDALGILAPGLAKMGKPRAAALLIGLVARDREVRGLAPSLDPKSDTGLAAEAALRELGRPEFDAWVDRGARLDGSRFGEILHADECSSGAYDK